MKVLSLFDGCGMAYQALKNLGIKVEKYYASEIDKYAIKICQKNHPDVIQLGDIGNISGKDLGEIDLVIGGFSCQSFSICGKQLDFNDPRGQLFFQAKRLIEETKPRYFLLENVGSMKNEIRNFISKELGFPFVKINSNLLSAQQRNRLYWTNIAGICQPCDQKLFFKDILFPTEMIEEKYFFSERVLSRLDIGNLTHCGVAGYKIKGQERNKATALLARDYKGMQSRDFNVVKVISATDPRGYKLRKLTPIECERLQTLPYNYTLGVSDSQRFKMIGNGFTVAVIEHILKGML